MSGVKDPNASKMDVDAPGSKADDSKADKNVKNEAGEEKDSDEESESESTPPPPDRVLSRRNRGTKMLEQLKNIDNEAFWKGKNLFELDEANEVDYSTESESDDYVDSDFDDSETEESEGEVKVDKERTRKRNVYQDPIKRAAKRRAVAPASAAAQASSSSGSSAKPVAVPASTTAKAASTRRPVIPLERRQSSRQSTIAKSSDLKLLEAAEAGRVKKRVSRKGYKVLTQEQQLEQAKQTEVLNRESLQRLLAEEEQAKQSKKQKRVRYQGPRVIFHSKKGQPDTITYTHGDFTTYVKPVPKAQPGLKCCISGLAARYKDPLTKLAYANISAFKRLRKLYQTDRKALATRAKKVGQRLFVE